MRTGEVRRESSERSRGDFSLLQHKRSWLNDIDRENSMFSEKCGRSKPGRIGNRWITVSFLTASGKKRESWAWHCWWWSLKHSRTDLLLGHALGLEKLLPVPSLSWSEQGHARKLQCVPWRRPSFPPVSNTLNTKEANWILMAKIYREAGRNFFLEMIARSSRLPGLIPRMPWPIESSTAAWRRASFFPMPPSPSIWKSRTASRLD